MAAPQLEFHPNDAASMIRTLAQAPDLLALQRAHPQHFPCLLESVATGTPRARYDLLAFHEGDGFALQHDGDVCDLATGAVLGNRFLEVLDQQFGLVAAPAIDAAMPFGGGWILLLCYELAAEIEPRLRLPSAAGAIPMALALRSPAAVVVDHQTRRAAIVAEEGRADLLDRIAALLADCAQLPVAPAPPAMQLDEEPAERFIDAVGRVKEYIRAGDVFQVNLSRRRTGRPDAPLDAAMLYRRLRRSNPAPFSALLQQPGWSILSSSPERLVMRRGDRIETRPIAGTRPRFPGDDDGARVRELVGHPKERAEHIMLIDLERNDLGRVSVPGSVQVDELMAVESYAHVHHIESTVSGTARSGLTPGALIRAVFPGGTITGCPKVRCMEIIAELEGEVRGPYTGALGWLDRSGDLDLNILIRTLTLEGDSLRFRAGAGIVADSDAQHELMETRAKARGLLRALGRDD